MGYSEEDSERKSIEEMGDAQDIAETLGELHQAYNVVPDLIVLAAFSAVLYCAYFLEKRFIFGDPGALSMLVCGIIAGAALFFLYAAYSSSKKHPAAGICAFAAGAIDLIYQYFMAKELSKLTDGEFKNLINFITNNKIYYDTNQYNNKLLITILCIWNCFYNCCYYCFDILNKEKNVLQQFL